jgi:hypothetical protein
MTRAHVDAAQRLADERAQVLEAVRLGQMDRGPADVQLASIAERGELLAAECGPGWRWQDGLVYSARWL